jgi:type II secretory pathway pseudopilin PulG
MVVVVIIALLAAIAIPNLLRARVNSNESMAQATLRAISNALENYYSINNSYPSTTTILIGIPSPYLSKDYFSGIYGGYVYQASLMDYDYSVIATPISNAFGSKTYTISTAGLLTSN